MEITIKINGRFVSVEVSAEVADYLEQARRNNRKPCRERQRYWGGRECDEYIISTDGWAMYSAYVAGARDIVQARLERVADFIVGPGTRRTASGSWCVYCEELEEKLDRTSVV